MNRMWCRVVGVAAAGLVSVCAAAQDAGSGAEGGGGGEQKHRASARPEDFVKLGQQAGEAFAKQDYEGATTLLRKQIELQPENGACWYNLALAQGRQGRDGQALEALAAAVERGFTDRARIMREPSLRGARGLEGFARFRDRWDEVMAAAGDHVLAVCKKEFGEGLREERDDELRVVFLAAADATLVSRAREELRGIKRFAEGVFRAPGGAAGAGDEPWVVIVLPKRKEFEAWSRATYGEQAKGSFNQIGGAYEHARKRLVAIDLGATLRHEFLHVLQFRELERLGQQHPIWIMEGFASLAEDMDFGSGANSVPEPISSWRTNIAQRMEKAGSLPTVEQLGAMDQLKFSAVRPLGNYAAARNFFMYLQSKGKLAEWWRVFTADAEHGLRADESGVSAIEQVMGKPIKEVDKNVRVWLRGLTPVAETIEPGMASLGVDVEAGNGEGPVVTHVVPRPRGNAHQTAPGVRPGDTLLSIDGKPTRDLAELVRVLGVYKPGAEVLIEVRRGTAIKELRVTLIER